MPKKIIMWCLLVVIGSVLGGYLTVAKNQEPVTAQVSISKEERAAPSQEKPPGIDIGKVMQDRFLGSADAPITIIEYASLTCPHCAKFHENVLPIVKKELIDTGKARLIFREFPLDKHAIKASAMARCAPPEKYFEMLGIIFKTQGHWTRSEDPLQALKDVGVANGMHEETILACTGNSELETEILKGMQAGQKEYSIRSTPSFIFKNAEGRMEKYPEFDVIFKNEHEH